MATENRRRAIVVAVLLLSAGVVMAATLDDPTPVANNGDGTVVSAADGPAVTLVGDFNASPDSGGTAGKNGIQWNTSAGNATFISDGPTNVTVQVDDLTGTWTRVSNLNVTANELKINPDDKPAINVSGDTDRLEFQAMALDDGTADFVYSGDSGETTVTVRSLSADQQIRAVDVDSGDVLAIATTDSNGVATLAGMPNSEHTVELKSGASNPILSDPRPDGNVSTQPDEFSVNVSDDDFPGDNVSVEFFYEGSKIDTKYTESGGRVSTSNVPQIDSGVHDWSVIATDDNGNQDILNNTVGLPGMLYIRNETAPSQLLDDNVTVTVAFEDGEVVETRTTEDGTIDMSGLPTTDFIVTAEADGYYGRTVYFQSIIGDTSVYMLNRSYDAVDARFTLDDPTGQYPTDSLVIVERAINRSGTNKYRTIYSDRFGTEGVTVDLQEGERFRISLRSPDGRVQQLGPYRADVSETVTVRPGSPTIELDEYEDGWSSAAQLTNRTLEYRYSDPEGLTQEVTIRIHEKGNPDNTLRPSTSYYDVGNVSGAVTLTENESEKTWVVTFEVDRDGETFTTQTEVSKRADLVPDLDRGWRLVIGIGLLIISAGIFSVLNAALGGVVVAIEGGILWWTGWLAGATTGAAVVIALFVAVLVHIYSSSGP